jgi:hypothetical protein
MQKNCRLLQDRKGSFLRQKDQTPLRGKRLLWTPPFSLIIRGEKIPLSLETEKNLFLVEVFDH